MKLASILSQMMHAPSAVADIFFFEWIDFEWVFSGGFSFSFFVVTKVIKGTSLQVCLLPAEELNSQHQNGKGRNLRTLYIVFAG